MTMRPALMTVATLAALLAGCGSECHEEGYERRFDLASHCKTSGACDVPMGTMIFAGSGGDDAFSTGSFELSPDQVVTVPVDPFRSELASKPVTIAFLSAGAPLNPGGAQILFDGKLASCTVDATEPTTQYTLRCDTPASVATLGFDYRPGLTQGVGYAAFSLSLYLVEATASGTETVCAR